MHRVAHTRDGGTRDDIAVAAGDGLQVEGLNGRITESEKAAHEQQRPMGLVWNGADATVEQDGSWVCVHRVGWARAGPHHWDQPIQGAPPGGRCYPDEAEVPLPYQVPQLKPRLGQVASVPAGALSGPLSASVSARRLAVGR